MRRWEGGKRMEAQSKRSSKLKAERKRIHRPDEISAKEISLGRRRRKGRREKIKGN